MTASISSPAGLEQQLPLCRPPLWPRLHHLPLPRILLPASVSAVRSIFLRNGCALVDWPSRMAQTTKSWCGFVLLAPGSHQDNE